MSDMDDTVQGEAPSAPNLDELTKVYIKIRDARDQLEVDHKKRVEGLQEQLDLIEQELLEACKTMNADSVRTPHGTVIRSIKSRYWTNDWDSMYGLIKEHGAFGLLEKRLHQTHMKEFLSENPDLLPAGLNVENSYTVVVRRAK
jgi:hypothetical protein